MQDGPGVDEAAAGAHQDARAVLGDLEAAVEDAVDAGGLGGEADQPAMGDAGLGLDVEARPLGHDAVQRGGAVRTGGEVHIETRGLAAGLAPVGVGDG